LEESYEHPGLTRSDHHSPMDVDVGENLDVQDLGNAPNQAKSFFNIFFPHLEHNRVHNYLEANREKLSIVGIINCCRGIRVEANRLTAIDVATKDKVKELQHEKKQLEKDKFVLSKDFEQLRTEL